MPSHEFTYPKVQPVVVAPTAHSAGPVPPPVPPAKR